MYVQLFSSFNNINKKNVDRNEKKLNKICNNYTKEKHFLQQYMFCTNLDAAFDL